MARMGIRSEIERHLAKAEDERGVCTNQLCKTHKLVREIYKLLRAKRSEPSSRRAVWKSSQTRPLDNPALILL
jgi:hypothetical protein